MGCIDPVMESRNPQENGVESLPMLFCASARSFRNPNWHLFI